MTEEGDTITRLKYDACVMALEKALNRAEGLENEVVELRQNMSQVVAKNEKFKADLAMARKRLAEQKKVYTAASKQADKMAREELAKQLAEASKREVALIVKLQQYEPVQNIPNLAPPEVEARAQAQIETQRRRAQAASSAPEPRHEPQTLAMEQYRPPPPQFPAHLLAVPPFSLQLPPPGPGIRDLRWDTHPQPDFTMAELAPPQVPPQVEVGAPPPRKRRRQDEPSDQPVLLDENGKKLTEPHKRCKFPGCTRYASFGFYEEGGPRPRQRCGEHKLPGMASCKNAHCQYPSCKTRPSYGYLSDGHAVRCKTHILPDMVCTVAKKCSTEGCHFFPSYGYPGKGRPTKCKAHQLEGMKRLYQDLCVAPCCERAPSYGYLDDTKASVCMAHRQLGQYNLKALGRCGHPLCEARPTWGFAGDVQNDIGGASESSKQQLDKAKPSRCPQHALTGMVDFLALFSRTADAEEVDDDNV